MRIWTFSILIIFVSVTFFLLMLPMQKFPQEITLLFYNHTWLDEACHAGFFFIITTISYLSGISGRKTVLWTVCFAGGTEVLQQMTGRSMSVVDMGFDIAGTALASVAAILFMKWRQRARQGK
tara:strand:- start:35 stop:403 length:369 start_codon:yes stop_codon:yes gene_type:complete